MEGYIDNWIEACKYPEDESFASTIRHATANRIGGHHLNREEVANKFKEYVLQKVSEPD